MARIVVVDDEPIIGEIATQVLTRTGHEVLMALNGQDAVNVLVAESASFSVAQSGSGSIAHVRFKKLTQRPFQTTDNSILRRTVFLGHCFVLLPA